ncbi:MAG TPA: ATP-dependent DNA helicase RecG [Solirubrobacteraceae bacterium]|nr:ATP-dependent DNA helicase RecG [Solirubrobacteraceae bacterium]
MSSSSFATVASRPIGGCSPPSEQRDLLPVGFADVLPLTRAQMLAAPVRWPRPSRLAESLDLPAGKTTDGMAALGIETVGDLLEHLPRDHREARMVAALREGEQATVAVQVRSIASRAVRKRGMRGLVEASVFDESGSMRATFFNQPWLASRYPPGTRLVLHGKADRGGRFRVSHHAIGSEVATGETGSVAHYPATEGVSSTQILALVRERRQDLADVVEPLSAGVRVAERLPARATALGAMHFYGAGAQAESARERLAFEELLLSQLVFLIRRGRRATQGRALSLSEPASLSSRWLEDGLPFELTGDQRKAIATIADDLEREQPMQRLLMGEVGSGKTVVALHAMLRAVEHGAQAALMAPTETLAQQHFATVQRLLGGESVTVALLTGSTAAARRADTLGKLSSGELSLVVGTHALIEPSVRFRELAVAVVDEQHRFGVRQRAALEGQEHARRPHVLHMTATPIPRTLALARYGDLDRSVLRELPRERKPIATEVVTGEAGREQAYRILQEQLRAGRQAYVVCPLVEQTPQEGSGQDQGKSAIGHSPPAQGREQAELAGGVGEAKAATAEFERLRAGELAGWNLALLHGQMRPREKQEAMEAFASGRAQVLVATTVIEVGVDVPNATVMLVENAERFGISQLHQLRGRVGRGGHSSTCMLVGPAGSARLRALAEHSDGFRLAEIDLRLRKEGELIGTRQSGVGQFKFAILPEDTDLLERARARARAILTEDPGLSGPLHGLLGAELERTFGAHALAPIPA